MSFLAIPHKKDNSWVDALSGKQNGEKYKVESVVVQIGFLFSKVKVLTPWYDDDDGMRTSFWLCISFKRKSATEVVKLTG